MRFAKLQQLVEEAPRTTRQLLAVRELAVVRWQWATASMRSFAPERFELTLAKRGEPLPGDPRKRGGEVAEGYDAQDHLVVERHHWGGMNLDSWFNHEPEVISQFTWQQYNDPILDKVLSVGCYFFESGRVVRSDFAGVAYNNQNSIEYVYDDAGRVSSFVDHELVGFAVKSSRHHEVERDEQGRMLRVVLVHDSGARITTVENKILTGRIKAAETRKKKQQQKKR